ncbi:hypothetical protein LCGC14_2756260 [marine sediment metagenome]|uniref:Uncharacterized protein n=1 Tax=marine sediment metagenome TaxID=412755 RepID=A0A0F9BRY8_9ZZZZ
MLTDAEQALIEDLGACATAFTEMAGAEVPDDLAEFTDKIHQLQHAVMAQSAARAYPEKYRLAGETHAI